jgi:hypothetical protein
MTDTQTPAEAAPIYYMWIGDSYLDLDKPRKHFVIQVKEIPSHRSLFAGEVVAVGPKSPATVTLGHTSKTWANPVTDTVNGQKPSFIRVPESYVIAKFPNFQK